MSKDDKKKSPNWDKGVAFVFTDFLKRNLDDGYEKVFNEYKDVIRGIAWGREVCPTSGKEHNQGFVQFYKQSRGKALQRLLGSLVHFGKMRGSVKDNETYCSKENKYKKLGAFVSRGYRSDLHNIKDDLKAGASMYEVMDNYTGDFVRYAGNLMKMKELIDEKKSQTFRRLTVTTLTGEAGSGKTRQVYEKHGYDAVFKIDGSSDDKFMFNGYGGQRVLLIDDFNGWIKYSYLLNILDGYPLPLNVKNGRTFAMWDTVYITSNNKPAMWYRSIKDNLKRRIDISLEVTKGNTIPLSNAWDTDDSDDEYSVAL
jgi:hypothetical protein